MAIKLNWDRIKQFHADLLSDGWKDTDKLLFVLFVEKNGKPVKGTIIFKELQRFCWNMIDDDKINIITFIIQDVEGRILYRHRQVVGNEEVPNGGNTDVVTHWAALSQDEKDTYITMLVAQIDAYER